MDAMDTTDATEAGGPTLGRRLLGAQLRRLREERGITRRDAAKAIRGSESKMSRLELGRHGVKVADVQDLLTRYGVLDPAAREEILRLARDANARGWWHGYNDVLPTWFERYLGLESAAERIHTYEGQFIPGLLQTEEYARAVTWVGQSRPHTGGLDPPEPSPACRHPRNSPRSAGPGRGTRRPRRDSRTPTLRNQRRP